MQTQSLPASPQIILPETDQIGVQIVFCDAQGRPQSSRYVRLAAYLRSLAAVNARRA